MVQHADIDHTGIPGVGGGGGGLTQAYVGYNTAGGSDENVTNLRVYAKKVTLASDGLLSSVEAYMSSDDNVNTLRAAVFADSGGTPTTLIAVNTTQTQKHHFYNGTAPVKRWIALAVGKWLTAGDYWIAIQTVKGGGTWNLAYDATGSDRYYGAGGDWISDWGRYAATTTGNSYSIRASVIS